MVITTIRLLFDSCRPNAEPAITAVAAADEYGFFPLLCPALRVGGIKR